MPDQSCWAAQRTRRMNPAVEGGRGVGVRAAHDEAALAERPGHESGRPHHRVPRSAADSGRAVPPADQGPNRAVACRPRNRAWRRIGGGCEDESSDAKGTRGRVGTDGTDSSVRMDAGVAGRLSHGAAGAGVRAGPGGAVDGRRGSPGGRDGPLAGTRPPRRRRPQPGSSGSPIRRWRTASCRSSGREMSVRRSVASSVRVVPHSGLANLVRPTNLLT